MFFIFFVFSSRSTSTTEGPQWDSSSRWITSYPNTKNSKQQTNKLLILDVPAVSQSKIIQVSDIHAMIRRHSYISLLLFFFLFGCMQIYAKTKHCRPGAILHASPSKDVSTVYVTNCLHSWNIVCTCEPDMGEA